MTAYQKKSAKPRNRGRGRPQHSADQKIVNQSRRTQDGARLAAALTGKGLRQADVARRTGISESNLSLLIHGNRDLNREDLRRLGEAGISADYLLGISDFVEPGVTRTRLDLAEELANVVWREARAAAGSEPGMDWPVFLRRDQLIPWLTEQVRREVKEWNEYNGRREAAFQGMDDLFVLVESGRASPQTASHTADQRIEKIVRLALPRPPQTELVGDTSEQSPEGRAKSAKSARGSNRR